MSGQINVAVDATPSTDLNQVMSEIRDHYEGVISKNRKELESWYQNKVRGRSCSELSRFGESYQAGSLAEVTNDVSFLSCSDGSSGAGCKNTHGSSGHKPHRDQGPEEHPPEAPD